MSYTLAAAAAATGLNKTTVLRAIKSGRISGTRNELGEWHVEPAELHRVYPPIAERGGSADAAPRYAPHPDLALLQQQYAILEGKLATLNALLDDMRGERDAWREQAQRLALPSPQPPMSLWRWLRSTG